MARRRGAVYAWPQPDQQHEGPVRTCVGCRARAPATGLLRVVAADGALVPDPRRRLPGRGAWLHTDPECLRTAERRRAFLRALRVQGPLDTAAVHAHLSGDPQEPALTPAPAHRRKQVDPS